MCDWIADLKCRWQGLQFILRRRRRLRATNSGRDSGWLVEYRGQVIADLSDPRFEEMFWVSYHLEVVTTDDILRERMSTDQFWTRENGDIFTWRNREFGEIVKHAFIAGSPFPEPGRITVRGLYLLA